MKPRAIDANVILRFITADHPQMSPRCRELFERVQTGAEAVFLPEAALCDVVWTLKSFYNWPADRISAFTGNLLAMNGLNMERKDLIWNALNLFEHTQIDFSDALIAAETSAADLEEIYSYDRDFDRVESVVRVEP